MTNNCEKCGHKSKEHTDFNEVYQAKNFSWLSDSLFCDICHKYCNKNQ